VGDGISPDDNASSEGDVRRHLPPPRMGD